MPYIGDHISIISMGKVDGAEETRLYCNSKRKFECIICRIKIEMPIRMKLTIMSTSLEAK